MIVTITPSPALDLTYRIEKVKYGVVNRAQEVTLEASGKGINVSHALLTQNFESVVIAPLSPSILGKLWREKAEMHHAVYTSNSNNEIRINTSLLESDGVTKVNQTACALEVADVNDFLRVCKEVISTSNPSWVVLSGSIHPKNSEKLIFEIVRIARQAHVKIAIDTSGEALLHAIAAKPDFIKPNLEELSQIYPAALNSTEDAIEAILHLSIAIEGTVICSNGEASAFASNGKDLLELIPPVIAGANSVGAGDAAVAGYVAAESSGSDFATAVKQAISWGVAACLNPKTAGLKGSDISSTVVTVKQLKSAALHVTLP